MRRLTVAAGVSAAGLLAGAAWSATLTGTEGPDRLTGTPSADAIDGRGGADVIDGSGGDDFLKGGAGRDVVRGGPGADRVAIHLDGLRDVVRCGEGADLVDAEPRDAVAADCELVAWQLSRDAYASREGQHETQVEPDSFSSGSTVVVAFQSGRMLSGGAAGIGWARSADAGRTWRSGFLPRLTRWSTPAGVYEVATDPVVAYDAAHRSWLIATLVVSADDHASLAVSRSADGVAWSRPLVLESAAEEPDKEWLVCDNGATSRFRGSCYLAYMDFAAGELHVRTSRDGGRSWSPPAAADTGTRTGAIVNGAQPVVRPDGTLVVLYSVFASTDGREHRIGAVRSTDGGAGFGPPARVADLHDAFVRGVRTAPLTSVDVDRAGRLYAVWADCRFREDCEDNDVVLATSRDGVAWSAPARVPATDLSLPGDAFAPAVAVAPAGNRLAITYYVARQADPCIAACLTGIDAALVGSGNGGRTWGAPRRLNAETMRLPWLADSTIGRFLGDYVSTSFAGGEPVAVFSLAGPPVGGEWRQAIFAARVAGAELRR